jgi:hypothetical protein
VRFVADSDSGSSSESELDADNALGSGRTTPGTLGVASATLNRPLRVADVLGGGRTTPGALGWLYPQRPVKGGRCHP